MKNTIGTPKSNPVEGQSLSLREAVLFLVFGYFLVPRGVEALAGRLISSVVGDPAGSAVGGSVGGSAGGSVGSSVSATAVANWNLLVVLLVDCLVLLVAWWWLRRRTGAGHETGALNGASAGHGVGVCDETVGYAPAFPEHALDLPSILRVLALALFGFDAANGISLLIMRALGTGISSLTMAASGADSLVASDGGSAATASIASVALTVLVIGIVIPIFEEVLIRGILYRGLRTRCGFWKAAVLSSALWGASHLEVQTAIATFFAGLLLALVYEKYGKLWLPIALHIGNNLLALPALSQYLPRINTPDTVGQTWILLLAEILIAGWLGKWVMDSGGPRVGKNLDSDV